MAEVIGNGGDQGSFLLLAGMALGFGIGLWYEVFRLCRVAFPSPVWLVCLEDLLFFLPLSPALIFFHYALCDGTYRWFSLCGVLLGFLFYLCTLGRLIAACSRAILGFIKKVLGFLARILLRPIKIAVQSVSAYFLQHLKKSAAKIRARQEKAKCRRQKKRILALAKKGFFN